MINVGAVFRHGRLAALATAGALACASLAACGSDSGSTSKSDSSSSSAGAAAGADTGSSGANVAEAKKRLEAALATPQWEAPGPAFDASKARGKKVMYIGVDNSIPIIQTILKAVREAGSKFGLKVDEFDGKGQVSEFNRGIQTAISQKYDAITVLAIPSPIIKAALADAKKAGIPVIQIQEHDAGAPLADGVAAAVSFCYSCAGRLIADYVIADSDGEAEGTIFVSKDVSNGQDEEGGMRKEFEELCPKCKFESQNVAVADWQKRIPTLTRSILTSKPNTKYLLPLYDSMTVPMIPAVVQAGKQGQVKIATWNATPSVVQEMGRGNVVSFDVGGANVWFGWGLADQLFRVLNGEPPVKDTKIPNRAFTRENLKTIDLKKDESTWYGDVDFRAEYSKLWGPGT
jgi:ribose transport system substrate-binding protein